MKIYSFMSLNQNIQESLSKSGIHLEIHSMEQITDKQLKKAFLENDILIIGLHHHMDAMWLKEITTPKIVATLSIGVDHIDSLYFQHPMIQVLHCVYGNTLSVAEHILALILALNKNMISSYHYVMGNTTQMNSITSTENSYQTLGLIGAGHISQKLIEIMSGFHMNILIYLSILIILILFLFLISKLLGNLGLIITVVMTGILSLITSFKYVTLTTININASVVLSITMYTSLYLLLENTTEKETKKIVILTFLINIFTAFFLFLMSYHTQALTDSISINMKNVFIENYRILITYPIANFFSSILLILLYQKIKKLYDIPFITTVTTYLVVGLANNLIFYLGSYLNIFTLKTILELSLSTYMIGLIITVIYSLILPKLNKMKVIK